MYIQISSPVHSEWWVKSKDVGEQREQTLFIAQVCSSAARVLSAK